MTELDAVLTALTRLRAPLQQGEYDLHRMVMDILTQAELTPSHEVRLAPRCRIDVMCGSVGIEIKRGKPTPGRLLPQLTRYCQCEDVHALILVCERSVALPHTLCGKPVQAVCLNRLWGIALS